MSEGEKLVPKLRFPEFSVADVWRNKSIGIYLVDCSGRVTSNTELPIYSSTREGLKRQDTYFNGNVLQNNNDYGIVPVECFVYRHMSDDGLFKFNINNTGGDIAVSKEYPVFKTKGLDPRFLHALLNDGFDFKKFAYSQKAGGTRTRLYFSRLCEWQTPMPSIAEQKKIADCLHALNELISAQASKVNVLKTHKKGLMQQLFPREGDTQPLCRFSEFRHTQNWVDIDFANVVFFQEGPGILAVDFRDEGVPLVRLSGLSGQNVSLDGCNYLEYKKVENKWSHFRLEVDDLLVSCSATFGLPTTVTDIAAGAIFYTGLVRFRPKDERLTVPYLKAFMGSPCFIRQAESLAVGGGIKHFGPTHLRQMKISVPSINEQQHIAASLNSLDTLIDVAIQELKTFKFHKKGLMQQLFPSAETV